MLPYIDSMRRRPLRASGLLAATGLASAAGYALGLAAAIGLGAMISATFGRPVREAPAAPARATPDSSRFILNALLVPALDPDSLPLRWVDPRPRLRCGPGTVVRVNGVALRPGAAVPDAPFDLEWWADECYPFGLDGARFDGGVRLTVFREDWGFRARVAPRGLIATSGANRTRIEGGPAAYPLCAGDGARSCL